MNIIFSLLAQGLVLLTLAIIVYFVIKKAVKDALKEWDSERK